LNSKQILTFSDFPNVTTGVFISKENLLVTGHQNGLVIKWDTNKGTYDVLFKCPSKIETISLVESRKIVVGSNAGNLLIIDLENPKNPEIIQEATYSVHSRVWRALSPKPDSIMMTSTYGVVNLLRKHAGDQWEKDSLSGHSNSVFGMAGYDGSLISSGDYRGNILIWEPEADLYKIIQRLKINQAVEDIAWHGDETFVVVDQSGRISLFEKLKSVKQWQLVFEIDNASSSGNCIRITEDGKTVFAGTDNEVIQFDIDSQQVGLIDIKGATKIFCEGNRVYVLTKGGFQYFERKEIEVPAAFIKYRYVKISLVGHTGVGKSTLCNFITTGSTGNVKSTFGKRVWTWTVPSDDKLEKRVIFHDHGGQKTVLGTFLPLLADSDIILVLFQKNDKTTFTTALETLEQLRKSLNPKTKIFFVQTFVDQDVHDFDENVLKKIIEEKKISGHFEVCPPTGQGIELLKVQLMKEVSWEDARIMIQSQHADGAIKTISGLVEKDVNVIAFDDLKDHYFEVLGSKVSARHLKFLLRDLSNQGIIDYHPEVSNLIIINDEEFNKLRTNVPIFVETKNGIVSLDELDKNFDHYEYLTILDSIYQNYKIAIKNRDVRIFPEKLKAQQISVPEPYSTFLKDQAPEERFFRFQEVEISRLIEALSELNLGCIDASQTDGLFSWGELACVYYSFQTLGDAIRGYQVNCTYFIGGKKKETVLRLKREFESIIEGFYGPSKDRTSNQVKKKF
jgi:WD40 repeat protein